MSQSTEFLRALDAKGSKASIHDIQMFMGATNRAVVYSAARTAGYRRDREAGWVPLSIDAGTLQAGDVYELVAKILDRIEEAPTTVKHELYRPYAVGNGYRMVVEMWTGEDGTITAAEDGFKPANWREQAAVLNTDIYLRNNATK